MLSRCSLLTLLLISSVTLITTTAAVPVPSSSKPARSDSPLLLDNILKALPTRTQRQQNPPASSPPVAIGVSINVFEDDKSANFSADGLSDTQANETSSLNSGLEKARTLVPRASTVHKDIIGVTENTGTIHDETETSEDDTSALEEWYAGILNALMSLAPNTTEDNIAEPENRFVLALNALKARGDPRVEAGYTACPSCEVLTAPPNTTAHRRSLMHVNPKTDPSVPLPSNPSAPTDDFPEYSVCDFVIGGECVTRTGKRDAPPVTDDSEDEANGDDTLSGFDERQGPPAQFPPGHSLTQKEAAGKPYRHWQATSKHDWNGAKGWESTYPSNSTTKGAARVGCGPV